MNGEIQLVMEKGHSCNFCPRREGMFTLKSSHPDRRLEVRLCRWCAEKLSLCFNSIQWNVQT